MSERGEADSRDVGESARPKRREIAFDVLKGIGIAEVLAHHTLNWSARKFYEVQSFEWWGLMFLNRLLHFAIPTFLLASSILLARSLSKRENPDFGGYAKRRALLTVWPFFLWSTLYLILRLVLIERHLPVTPYTWSLPWGDFTGPATFMDPAKLKVYYLWGKAYFHLYFLSILTQLSILLPFVLLTFRKVRLSFGATVAMALGLQGIFHVLQGTVIKSPYPGTMVFSYLPALMIGVWLGMNWSQWPEVWARWRVVFVSTAVLAGIPYMFLSLRNQIGETIPPYALGAAFSLYATATGLSLLGFAEGLDRHGKPVRLLSAFGNLSLPLFLIHPFILFLMGGRRGMAFLQAVPLTPLVAYLLLIAVTWIIIQVLIRLRLDRFLFGRRFGETRSGA